MTRKGSIAAARRWLSPGVVAIGFASLLSDVGHETATAILPLFLAMIGGSPFALGLIEGLADFGSSGTKLWAGYIGARLERRKLPAASAYFVTALATSAFALATNWLHILVARTVAWLGRGFRGPLRDTLLAEQVDPAAYGRAFGFERALDTIGAILGPLLALALVAAATPLRRILLLTVIPGMCAGLLFLTVRERGGRRPGQSFRQMTAALPVSFRRFLVAVGVFGAGDFSRTLLILWAIGIGVRITGSGQLTLPILLYAAYNVVGAASAYVFGGWSDRLGRPSLLIFGYLLAAVVSALMALDVRPVMLMAGVFAGSGVYIGIEEALERAAAADLLPPVSRAFGFGALAAVNGLGDLFSSALAGLLWQVAGAPVAFGTAAVFSLAGAVLLRAAPFPKRPSRSSR